MRPRYEDGWFGAGWMLGLGMARDSRAKQESSSQVAFLPAFEVPPKPSKPSFFPSKPRPSLLSFHPRPVQASQAFLAQPLA